MPEVNDFLRQLEALPTAPEPAARANSFLSQLQALPEIPSDVPVYRNQKDLDLLHEVSAGLIRQGAPSGDPALLDPPDNYATNLAAKAKAHYDNSGLATDPIPNDPRLTTYLRQQLPTNEPLYQQWTQQGEGADPSGREKSRDLEQLNTARFMIAHDPPTYKEATVGFNDALADWTNPKTRHFTQLSDLVGFSQKDPYPTPPPIDPAHRAALYNIYAKWLGHGSGEPGRDKDVHRLDYLSEPERKLFDSVDGDNFFTYWNDKSKFYVSRNRMELITRNPEGRDQPPTIQHNRFSDPVDRPTARVAGAYKEDPSLVESVPSSVDYPIDRFVNNSNFARWYTLSKQNEPGKVSRNQAVADEAGGFQGRGPWGIFDAAAINLNPFSDNFLRGSGNWNWRKESDVLGLYYEPTVPGRPDVVRDVRPPWGSKVLGEAIYQKLPLYTAMATGPVGTILGLGFYAASASGVMEGLGQGIDSSLRATTNIVSNWGDILDKPAWKGATFYDSYVRAAFGHAIKGLIGDEAISMKDSLSAARHALELYPTKDADEAQKYMDARITTANMVSSVFTRLGSRGGPLGSFNPLQPLANEYINEGLANFVGAMGDNAPDLLMMAAIAPWGAKKVSRGLESVGIRNPESAIRTPMQEHYNDFLLIPRNKPSFTSPLTAVADAASYIRDRGVAAYMDAVKADRSTRFALLNAPNSLLPGIMRGAVFSKIDDALGRLQDPAAARALLERAGVEAEQRGPVDARFAAVLTTAVERLGNSERYYGASVKKIAPDARAALEAMATPIQDLGLTQAWYVFKGQNNYFHPPESARNAGAVLDQLNRFASDDLPEIRGSAADYLQTKGLKEFSSAILADRARRQEIVNVRAAGLEVIDHALPIMVEEAVNLKATIEVAERTHKEALLAQGVTIVRALGASIEADQKGYTRKTLHPDVGGAAYDRVLKARVLDTPQDWLALASDRKTIEAIGGEKLWQELQDIQKPRQRTTTDIDAAKAALTREARPGAPRRPVEPTLEEQAVGLAKQIPELRDEIFKLSSATRPESVQQRKYFERQLKLAEEKAARIEQKIAEPAPATAPAPFSSSKSLGGPERDPAFTGPAALPREYPTSFADEAFATMHQAIKDINRTATDPALYIAEGVARTFKEVTLRLGEEIPRVVVSKAITAEALVNKYTDIFMRLAHRTKPGANLRPTLEPLARSLFNEAVDLGLAAVPDAAYRTYAARTASSHVQSAAMAWIDRIYRPLEEFVPPKSGDIPNSRLKLYESIARKTVDNDLKRPIKLTPSEYALLNEIRQSPLGFEDLPAKLDALRLDNRDAAQKLRRLDPLISQLVEHRATYEAFAKEPRPGAPGGPAGPPTPGLPGGVAGPPTNPLQAAATAADRAAKLPSFSKGLDRYLTELLASPEWAVKGHRMTTFTNHITKAEVTALEAYRDLQRRLTVDIDMLQRPETLLKKMIADGATNREIELARLDHGAAKFSTLDHAFLAGIARTSKDFSSTYAWTFENSYAAAAGAENALRYKAHRVTKWLRANHTEAEVQNVITEMASGVFKSEAAQAAFQRTLYDLLADSYKSGVISSEQFAQYVGKDGYYHGVFEGPEYARLAGSSGRLPIPGRFRPLEVHPYEFSFKIPEDSFYVTWRTRSGKLQYQAHFATAEEAAAWAETAPIKNNAQVSINSPWTIAEKEAAGMVHQATHSLSHLAAGMSMNNSAAKVAYNLSRSAMATTQFEAEANGMKLSKNGKELFDPETQSHWIKVNDPHVPHLNGMFIHEHAVQWLGTHQSSYGWIRNLLEPFQEQTGTGAPSSPSTYALAGKNNMLVPMVTRLADKVVGRFPAGSTWGHAIVKTTGAAITISKVLLAPGAYMQQITSNVLYNMPAMGFDPLAGPTNFANFMRYGWEGMKSYMDGAFGTKTKQPFTEPIWNALYSEDLVQLSRSEYHNEMRAAYETTYKGVEGLSERIKRGKLALGNATTAQAKSSIAANVVEMEGQLAFKLQHGRGFWNSSVNTINRIVEGGYNFVQDKGAVSNGFFKVFGMFDHIAKYASMRHLIENKGMSVEGALSRVKTFGQNLEAAPQAIKDLSNRLGGNKFTTYPWNQIMTLRNNLRHQPAWFAGKLIALDAYNNAVSAARGDDLANRHEVWAKMNGYGHANIATKLMQDMSRVELPQGGSIDLSPIWGIFQAQSPWARGVDRLIKGQEVTSSSPMFVGTVLAQAANALSSKFVLGQAALNMYGYVVSKRGPNNSPLNEPSDLFKAMLSQFTPDWAPPSGRDFEEFWNPPAVNPLTNEPHSPAAYWARRFLNYHPASEMGTWAVAKVAMDSVLRAKNNSGTFYGNLNYGDLLEVKARAGGGPIKADGTVDMPALIKLTEEHFNDTDGNTRAFAGLGDDEFPNPRSAKFVYDMALKVQEPRLIRNFQHFNIADMFNAYMILRASDHKADPAVIEQFERAFFKKATRAVPSLEMQKALGDVFTIWRDPEYKNSLPPGAFERGVGLMMSVKRSE